MNWTAEQKKALAFGSNLCVLAGAGSGKTRTLVDLVMGLVQGTVLEERLDLSQILAMTYTEKAAREMRDRVRQSLNEQIRHSSADDQLYWIRQRRLLDRASISTIHSFCLNVLRQFGPEAGLDPDFSILDNDLDFKKEIKRETLLDLIQAEDPDLLDLLEYFPWHSRGLAMGLDTLSAFLIDRSRCLGRKAHPGLRQATGFLYGPFVDQLVQAANLVANFLEQRTITPDKSYYRKLDAFSREVRLLSDRAAPLEDWLDHVDELMAHTVGNWYAAKIARDQARPALEALLSERDRVLSLAIKQKLALVADKLGAAVEEAKARRSSLDFDDLLLKTRCLLSQNIEVRRKLKRRYKVVLVDEFQDTNRLQADILALLVEPESLEKTFEDAETTVSYMDLVDKAPRRLVVFGDPKQSIYLFRGAEVAVFNRLRQAIEGGGQTGQDLVSLSRNFRSQEKLIEFFNVFFTDLANGSGGLDWQYGNQDRQKAHRSDRYPGPGVLVLYFSGGKTAREQRELEGKGIAAYLQDLFAGRRGVLAGDAGKTVEPRDVAILLRRFTHLQAYEKALKQAGLPFYTVRGKGFYHCPEVLDLINLVTYLADPGHEPALLGLLRSPLFGVSDNALTRLIWPKGAGGGPRLADYFDHSGCIWPEGLDPGDAKALEEAATLLLELRCKSGRAFPAELLEEAIEKTDFVSVLLTQYQGEQKVANVQKLIELVRNVKPGALFLLSELSAFFKSRLAESQEDPEAQINTEDSPAIKIMTIHQAKGLQFPVVVVPDAGARPKIPANPVVFGSDESFALRFKDPETNVFRTPSDYNQFKTAHEQNEKSEYARLLYVAATRAMDHLVFTATTNSKNREDVDTWAGWLNAFAGKFPQLVQTESFSVDAVASPEHQDSSTEPGLGGDYTEHCRVTLGSDDTDKICSESNLPINRILDQPRPVSNEFHLNMTGLAEFLSCPRRYYLENIMGLPAQAPPSRKPLLAEPQGYLREKGIIFHELLERFELGRSPDRAELLDAAQGLAEGQGWKLRPDDFLDLIAKVEEFLASDWGRPLVADAGLLVKREMPVWLQVGRRDNQEPVLTLSGEMDLFYVDQERRARVLDYKYTEPKDSVRYEAQLKTYALALSRAGISSNLEAALYYANPGGASRLVEIALPSGWEQHFEARILEAARTLGLWQQGGDVDPGTQDCPNAEDCEFLYACGVSGGAGQDDP
jgi:ATP-dependent helicase/nuclease subunit A